MNPGILFVRANGLEFVHPQKLVDKPFAPSFSLKLDLTCSRKKRTRF